MISFLEGLEKWKTRISIAVCFRYSFPPSKASSTTNTETNTISEIPAVASIAFTTPNIDKSSPSKAMELTIQITLPPPYDTFLPPDLETPDVNRDSSEKNDVLPSYKEHRRSPRCEEDIFHPAPSYRSHFIGAKPSGADKLADWLVARTSGIGKKSKSERIERRSTMSGGMAGSGGRGSVQRRRTGTGLSMR
jgi:hypothetical protein